MEEQKSKPKDEDSSSQSAVERGKKAIEADEMLNKKDLNDADKKKEAKEDAEQWRNEG